MVTAAAAQTDTPAPINIVLQSFPITVAAGDYELILTCLPAAAFQITCMAARSW